MRKIFDQYLAKHPEMVKKCIGAIGSDSDAGPTDEDLSELVELLMALFGNPRTLPKRSRKVFTEVNAQLIEAWRAAAGDKDTQVCKWLVEGAPAGINREYTTCGIFPEVDKTGDKFDLSYYDEAFTNYASVDEDPAAK